MTMDLSLVAPAFGDVDAAAKSMVFAVNLNRQEVYSRLRREGSRTRARDPGTGTRKASATRLLKKGDHCKAG